MVGEYTELSNDPKIKLIYYSSDIVEGKLNHYNRVKFFSDTIPFNINILQIHTETIYQSRKYLEYFLIEKHELCLETLNKYKCIGVNLIVERDKNYKLYIRYTENFWWSQSSYIKNLSLQNSIIFDENCNQKWLIGNVFENDYRHFLSLHNCEYDLTKQDIEECKYRFDLIKKKIIYNLKKSFVKTKPIYGVYFICCIGNYLNILLNQLNNLIKSGLYDQTNRILCFVCCKQEQCIDILKKYDKIEIISTVNNEYEQFAINNYKKYITDINYDLFYIHTKGVSRKDEICYNNWRMICGYFTINKWKLNIELLNYYDCVGINLKNYPKKHFSGNFWWAKSEHLNKLQSINDGYLSPEMYVLSYIKTNCISLHQTNVNHCNTPYPPEKYIFQTDDEIINNITIIPIFNNGDDKKCINQCGNVNLENELPILEFE